MQGLSRSLPPLGGIDQHVPNVPAWHGMHDEPGGDAMTELTTELTVAALAAREGMRWPADDHEPRHLLDEPAPQPDDEVDEPAPQPDDEVDEPAPQAGDLLNYWNPWFETPEPRCEPLATAGRPIDDAPPAPVRPHIRQHEDRQTR